MTDPQVKVYITAQDAFSSELDKFKRKMGEVAGGMTFTTSATGRWEDGLRKLATQQNASTEGMLKGITAGSSWTSGISKASNAVTNLAGNLLGANNQVSNVAEGLLSAFGGGGVVTVAATGVTLLAGAFLYFTEQAREAKRAYDAYMDSLRKQTPLAIVGAQLDEATLKLDELKKAAAGIAKDNDFGYGAGNQGENPLVSEVKKQQEEVDRLTKQYNQIKNSMYDTAGAAAAALQIFDQNVSATQKAVAEIFENTAKNWNKIPGVLRDMNSEIATFRQLIASSVDPLEQLRLKERLEDLIKLRDRLATFKSGSPFGASVGGDQTRQGASAAEEAAAIARTQNQGDGTLGGGALSTAMSERYGGDAGISDYGQFLREQFLKFSKDMADMIQTDFAQTLGNAIASAFQTAFSTGDPLKALQSFGASMLAGIGDIFVKMGETYLKFGAILKPLVTQLFNPVTSAWASTAIGIGLIALGKALRAVASSSANAAGGGSNRGGFDGYSSAQSELARERRENGTLTVIWDKGFANPDDPDFQHMMTKTMELAAERGVTRVRFIPRRA